MIQRQGAFFCRFTFIIARRSRLHSGEIVCTVYGERYHDVPGAVSSFACAYVPGRVGAGTVCRAPTVSSTGCRLEGGVGVRRRLCDMQFERYESGLTALGDVVLRAKRKARDRG